MYTLKRLVPNLFTAGSLIGGIFAIIFALKGRLDIAPYCILIAAFFDFSDGFMARLLKVQSELGKQLDSLADMVTFGVAPGIIVFQLLKLSSWSQAPWFGTSLDGAYNNAAHYLDPDKHIWVWETLGKSSDTELSFFINRHIHDSSLDWLTYLALIIPVFALFRLAKFNLDPRQSDSFIGVPTPAVTLFFVALPLIIVSGLEREGMWRELAIDLVLNPLFLISTTVILSVLMVSEIPLFALKFKSFGWKGNELRYSFLTISAILLATLFVWALPIIVLLYIILSLISNIVNKRKNEVQSGN